ncbi:MAG TPA: TonB-dependent receptor [Steroidobacteraceae bacterium]
MQLRLPCLPGHRASSLCRAFVVVLVVLIEPIVGWTADQSVLLDDLLQEIQRSGVQLIYSSDTFPADLRVIPPPPQLTLEARLRALLSPFHLEARRLPTGGYVVARTDPLATLEITVLGELNESTPLSGAEVSLVNTQRHARTDRFGRAVFTEIPPAAYLVEVKFDGLRPIQHPVKLTSTGETTHVTLRVTWEPTSLEEIAITSNRYDTGSTQSVQLSREVLESLPVTSSDAVRSLQLLPGAAVAGYSAKTHVRGSRDDETLFRYDGATLSDPYHLEAFQSLLGAIDPAVIESTTSWTGVAPIQFGGRIGAVVDIEPRAITQATADAKLSNREAGLLLGMPLDDARGTVFAAARLSNAYSPAQWPEPDSLRPDYRDYVLRTSWDVAAGTRLAVGAFALDDLHNTLSSNTAPRDQRARIENRERYVWIRLFRDFAPQVHSETLLSHESSANLVSGGLQMREIENGFLAKRDKIASLTVRQEFTLAPLSNWSLQLGAEYTNASVDNTLSSRVEFDDAFVPGLQPVADVQQDSDIALRAVALSIYGAAQWQPNERVLVDLGLRCDSRQYDTMVGSDSHCGIRTSSQWRVSKATLIRLGAAQTSQASIFEVARAADGTVQAAPARLQSQVNLGVEQVLDGHWFLRSEIYDKRERSAFQTYEDILSPFSLLPEISVGNQLISSQGARMFGLEARLESDRSMPLSGWLSYAWSRAEDEIAGQWVPRSWDQPNAVQLGSRWHQGPWQFTGLFTWHSGWPYTPLLVTNSTGANPSLVSVTLAPRNSERLENFYSLDLRLSWDHPLFGGVFQMSLELNDVTNSKSVCCGNYAVARSFDDGSQLTNTPGYWVGFSPAVGFRWRR